MKQDISRRRFIKGAALLAGGATAAVGLNGCSPSGAAGGTASTIATEAEIMRAEAETNEAVSPAAGIQVCLVALMST